MDSKKQLLKRIAALVSENKELKEKYKSISESFDQLSEELERYKKRSMDETAGKKQKGNYKQVRFDTVTILFVEIKGFSTILDTSSDMTSQMDKLDALLFRFNEVAEKHRLVKLQSIGDNFICAGGIPEKNITNPITVTIAALEMLHIVEKEAELGGQQIWKLNIGIHTGSVISRMDSKDQNYHLKGDTVNVVSRIVSVGKENTITISASTYELIKELFDCTYFNTLPVKYQNRLELFTVNGIHSRFALDKNRYLPNDAFRIQFLLIQFGDLQEHVLDMLEKKLPDFLYYHNVKHTVDVVTESELIGWAEGLNDQQLLLLKTAALFHDAGHTISYADHEERSTEIAREMLPHYQYTPQEIDEICRIIMATKLPPKPTDILEEIICDSDLDYLGRTDFIPVSNALYEELKAQNKMTSLNEWNKLQIKFIGSHQYFTKTGRNLREVKKQEQIERIKQLIED
ncbi:MAG: HD domain-containing protein [Bacteroidales bacterium]|jgi:class 3 adenylate cyclase/predicted metal-dependent HD superfamily phosphohydrolase|nr:HD domain-containing protein [Bacteroidales bacterium]